jgi:hypothetical protein
MAATIIDGPEIVYGNLGNIEAGVLSPEAVPDPNQDAGPNLCFQGEGVLDPRLIFLKDKMIGYTGMAQAAFMVPELESVRQIPVTASATNIIATAAHTVAGTPFALPTTGVLGINPNIPVRQFSAVSNAGPVVNALALDFGFGFGTAVAGSTAMTVGNGFDYFAGMPVVISPLIAASTPLLTLITAVNVNTNTITLLNAPTFAGTCAIGTGDQWGPNEVPLGYPTPQAALPFIAQGPGLFFDARQGVSRCIVITTVVAGSSPTFIVSGMDVYGQPMTQSMVAAAGAAGTIVSTKAFKYITSIVPQNTDATGTYTVGTTDVFGFAYRSTLLEDMEIYWAGALFTGGTMAAPSSAGYTPAVLTQPSTPALGDVRGTFAPVTAGGGASSGGFSGLVLTGRRLEIVQRIGANQATYADQLNPFYLFGTTQA